MSPEATPPEEETPEKAIKRYRENFATEIDGIAVYRMLAELEEAPARRKIFEELAEVEEHHADVWRKKLREAGVEPDERGPSIKARMIGVGARVFGVRSMLPIVRSMEAGAFVAYMGQDEAAQAMAPDERDHRRTMSRLERTVDAEPSDTILTRESWHRSAGSGTLRASIFGASDGLVSNTALVMGFAGAQTESSFVLLAGIAGLLAGAFSMAAGEYVSMRSQRELFERQIDLERQELEISPEEEERELSLIYQAKGLHKAEADLTAARLMEDPEVALDTLVRVRATSSPAPASAPLHSSPSAPASRSSRDAAPSTAARVRLPSEWARRP